MKRETLIEILDKPSSRSDEVQRPIRPYKFKDEEGRRRGLSPRHPFLNVYDLGQLAGGENSNLHSWRTSIIEPYVVSYNGGTFPPVIQETRSSPGTGAALARRISTWNDDYLASSVETWPATFKKITDDLDTYDIQIVGFDEFVINKGLRSSTETDSITVIPVGPDTDENRDQWFYRSRDVYFTNDPDSGASQVSFVLDKNCDLFLVPVAFWGQAYAAVQTLPSGFPRWGYESFIVQRPLSRPATLNNSTWASYWVNKWDNSSLGGAERAMIRSMYIDDPDAEAWRARATHAAGSQTIDAENPMPFAFPNQGDFTYVTTLNPHINLEGTGLFYGHLVGAIRKHITSSTYEWFYMWTAEFWQIPTPPDPHIEI